MRTQYCAFCKESKDEKLFMPFCEDNEELFCNSCQDRRFDVVIINDSTGEVVSTIGKNLRLKKAERREETAWSKIDSTRFSPELMEAKQ